MGYFSFASVTEETVLCPCHQEEDGQELLDEPDNPHGLDSKLPWRRLPFLQSVIDI